MFKLEPVSRAVLLGAELVLNCNATTVDDAGYEVSVSGATVYRWLFNNATSTLPAQSLIFTNHSLYVPRMTSDDLGGYLCRATCNNQTTTSRLATVVAACKYETF